MRPCTVKIGNITASNRDYDSGSVEPTPCGVIAKATTHNLKRYVPVRPVFRSLCSFNNNRIWSDKERSSSLADFSASRFSLSDIRMVIVVCFDISILLHN